jgi:hypothetical protein
LSGFETWSFDPYINAKLWDAIRPITKREERTRMFDVTIAAQSYSEVAGIIAAFSFAALVWLVERLQRQDSTEDGIEPSTVRALVLLVMTFVGNVLTSLLWAQVSGELDSFSVRTSLLSWLTGLNFGIVVPVMLQSIIFVTVSTRAAAAIPLFRRILFASVLLCLGQQWASTTGLLKALSLPETHMQSQQIMFLVCLPLSGAFVLAGALASRRALDKRQRLSSDRSFGWFISVWLAAVIITAVAFGMVRSIGGGALQIPVFLIGAANVIWSAILGWALVFLPV